MAERIQEILARQKAAAIETGNLQAAKALGALQLRVARLKGRGFFVPDTTPEVTPIQKVSVLTRETFLDYLRGELRTRGQEIALPEPSQAIVEVHNILAGSGFDVAPVVYVDRKKGEATYGVLETVVRPNYTDGTQMYYDNPAKDPLAQILKRGRPQIITVPVWARHVPATSRFALSWNEIHNFVVPEVVSTTPRLKEVIENGISFRVPTRAEFQSAGEKYPHFGSATNSWEWLYDSTWFVFRRVGGDRVRGGLKAVFDWLSDYHYDNIGFRLQAVSPSQELPR